MALQAQLLPPLANPCSTKRRDVAGLCFVYNTHKHSPQSGCSFRQPGKTTRPHHARLLLPRDHQLSSLLPRTETSLRSSFHATQNVEPAGTTQHKASLYHHHFKTFKSAVNAWITQP
ncbi:hypothetical protein GWK47_054870 [Chionoecetes opilio]|uniref:Uncharacterized protein n=1 Tax=Chionoecetes opilio TaxID=41210 RepID=A0A8J5CRI6_CHIOP|nr:hypothetical protein GWK47_054870 [Chionoecetes opilio]